MRGVRVLCVRPRVCEFKDEKRGESIGAEGEMRRLRVKAARV